MRRDVKAKVKAYKVNLGWSTLEVLLVDLPRKIEATVIANLSREYKEPLTVGLPEEVVNPCSLALAYLYTLEDLDTGTRIRNKAILLLMNLLGLNQAKDVVEAVKDCKTVALIGTRGEPEKVLADVASKLGIKEYYIKPEEANCTLEDENLEKITLSRINMLR
jgi:hypothetical protein